MNKRKFYYLLGIAGSLFCYCYYAIYKLLGTHSPQTGIDFERGCIAAGNFLSGRPLYDMPAGVDQYFYFPPVTLLYLPFTPLSPGNAKLAWFWLSQILVLLSLWLAYRLGRGKDPLRALFAVCATAASSTPLYAMLHNGNINVVLFSGLAALYTCLFYGRTKLAAWALALFAAIKIFPAILLGVLVRARDKAALRHVLLAAALLLGLSVSVFNIGPNLEYLRHLPSMNRYSGTLHVMSLTFPLKIFFPGLSVSALFFSHLLFLAGLLFWWWETGRKSGTEPASPGQLAADTFALTLIMILAMPPAWLMYGALLIVPFYFVILAMLGDIRRFKYPAVFLGAFIFINCWEFLYYHLPLPVVNLTARQLQFAREAHPLLHDIIFSGHFIATFAILWWVMKNYRQLEISFGDMADFTRQKAACGAARS